MMEEVGRFFLERFGSKWEDGDKAAILNVASTQPIYKTPQAASVAEQCFDDELQVVEKVGGPPRFRSLNWGNSCEWAIARTDVRFIVGMGCEVWGGSHKPCCATCQTLNSSSFEHIRRMRSVVISNWRKDSFHRLKPATYYLYLATQKYFVEDSIVQVAPTGVKNYYLGVESILEYYTLQNRYFSPDSFRLNSSYYEDELPFHEATKGDRMLQQLSEPPQFDNMVRHSDKKNKWPDFNHWVWRDSTTVLPIQRAYHNFRVPNAPNKDNYPMVKSFGNPFQLCALIQDRCTGPNEQFPSIGDCLQYMKNIPLVKLGFCPGLAGNTQACRWTHAILAQDGLRPQVHCFHMGPHKPDPNGKVKCHDDECGYERQGFVDCDESGCTMRYLHAGQVVDWMHAGFWLCCLAWSLLPLYKGNADTTGMLKASQLVRKKLQAVNVVFIGVAAIQSSLFLVVASTHVNILWRPWPGASTAPRFIETREPEQQYITADQYIEHYPGQHSETILSGLNMYIVLHITFYLLATAMYMVVILLEWIGHRVYSAAFVTSILNVELPVVGDAIFVLFVAIAITTPTSSFSLMLFIIGVTKLGNPEILKQCWIVWDIPLTEDTPTPTEGPSATASRAKPAMSTNRRRTLLRAASVLIRKPSMEVKKRKGASVISVDQVVSYLAAVGLMLHHFMMCTVFAGNMAHVLTFDEDDIASFSFTLQMILFLVLAQHVVHQLFSNGIFPFSDQLGLILLIVIEVSFQWYCYSNLRSSPTTLTTVAVFSLALSHVLMAPEMFLHGMRMLVPDLRALISTLRRRRTIHPAGAKQGKYQLEVRCLPKEIQIPLPEDGVRGQRQTALCSVPEDRGS